MTRVLNVCTVPMTGNGIAKQIELLNRETGGISVAYFGEISEDLNLTGAALYALPDRLRRPVSYLSALANLVRREGFSTVHIHGNSNTMALDLLAAYLGGAGARIAHCHNTSCVYGRLSRALSPAFSRLVTRRVACGREAGEWLYGDKPFTVVPVAVDADAFAFDPAARASARAELELGASRAIGCAAGLSDQKNHAALLRAFARLDGEPVLVLMGDGEKRGELGELARELGILHRCRFLGYRRDMPRLLSAMDAMALASRHEGFPAVALEWQCAGLPCALSDKITRDCALTEDVVFADPEDAAGFAVAISRLPSPDRAESSRRGIERVRRAGYDAADLARAMERIWSEPEK